MKDNAKLYYEITGTGTPIIMVHAGVADSRQWNTEFDIFSRTNQVLRYDMRGYGKSEPVRGEFSHLGDLTAIIDALKIEQPFILMGCSMGGGLAMDFTLKNPEKVKALIMVSSAPPGLELDLEEPPQFTDAVKAFEEGDLDLVAEIETQIWFDGVDRTPEQVDQKMRKLLFEMNRTVLEHEVKQLGKRQADTDAPAFDRLNELKLPVLIILGSQDIPYMSAAADFMAEKIQSARKIDIEDAAHLPNMDQPLLFQTTVMNFLDDLVPKV